MLTNSLVSPWWKKVLTSGLICKRDGATCFPFIAFFPSCTPPTSFFHFRHIKVRAVPIFFGNNLKMPAKLVARSLLSFLFRLRSFSSYNCCFPHFGGLWLIFYFSIHSFRLLSWLWIISFAFAFDLLFSYSSISCKYSFKLTIKVLHSCIESFICVFFAVLVFYACDACAGGGILPLGNVRILITTAIHGGGRLSAARKFFSKWFLHRFGFGRPVDMIDNWAVDHRIYFVICWPSFC